MAIYTGQHGQLFHEKNPSGVGSAFEQAAQVKNWQINMTQQMLEVTKLGDTWTDRLGGLKAITGTCELIYYRTDNNKDGTASKLFDRFLSIRVPRLNTLSFICLFLFGSPAIIFNSS